MRNRGASRAWFRPIAMKEGTGAVRIEKRGTRSPLDSRSPSKGNAISREMLAGLGNAMAEIEEDHELRAAIFRGAETACSALAQTSQLGAECTRSISRDTGSASDICIRLARATVDPSDRRDHGALNWPPCAMCASTRRT